MAPAAQQETRDCMLPGPPSRNNFGSADMSPSGLLAYAAGSSISVVDSRSLQLIGVIPIPPPASTSSSSSSRNLLSPFVTSVRWSPIPMRRDLLTFDPSASNSHLLIAAGDRQGRIALVDFRLRAVNLWIESSGSGGGSLKLGIQDLCWIQARPDSYLLAAINGASILSLYNTSDGRCIFKYDASPECLCCIRRDPFDSRHFCVLGLKGLLISGKVLGDTEDDVVIKELQVRTDCSELQKVERDASRAADVAGFGSMPASGVFPLYMGRLAFSPQWKHILFVTFPRELLVFDLQYKTTLFAAGLPGGCGKFLDVLPDPNNDLLYCAHLDGRISTWRRKEGEQAHEMCTVDELMPSTGTPVPSPLILAVVICQSDSTVQNISKLYSELPHPHSFNMDFNSPFDFPDETMFVSKTHLVTISDDGKIWNWLLTAEEAKDTQTDSADSDLVSCVDEIPTAEANDKDVSASEEPSHKASDQLENGIINKRLRFRKSSNSTETAFKMSLVGQLQLLSSTVSMLAVPSPSLTATVARGGSSPAVAVPLVALGTQSGTVDIIDVSANAIAASFCVHNGVIRGLQWLGNSRLVSFSYTQVDEKAGGYINKLAVTCLRSGLNRSFRVLQKPERAPIRSLRTSSSGRYLLILFRDAPVEVWAMTKKPILLRSLALPFTVLEWTLPTTPRPVILKQSSKAVAAETAYPKTNKSASSDFKASAAPAAQDGTEDDTSESFAFALVNGALGVFEVHGRRIRDFRPKWPSSSFVSMDGSITAMAYRLPHVVIGYKSGNIRWWDVVTGSSSSFNTHRDGIKSIMFSPVVAGDHSRGRISVLFYDNTFTVYDLDSQDPLANSLLQPQFQGTVVLDLDWLHLRNDKSDPLVLCIAGADSSFRLVEVNVSGKRSLDYSPRPKAIKERFRPMPLCSPVLLPTPHALALRMILQLGVKPYWFSTKSTTHNHIPGMTSPIGDLRSYMIDLPPVGDSVVPELLLKVLEPYRKEGCILDNERARLYATVANKGAAVRFAIAAAIFGETSEALFWLKLPHALKHLMSKIVYKSRQKAPALASNPELDESAMLSRITSKGKSATATKKAVLGHGQLKLMAFEQEELLKTANERIPWHEKLEGEEVIQNQVHELVSVGNLEGAVSLLLSSSPESPYFYANALRAVTLSSAVSKSLLELAVKVVAANMVRTDQSLYGTHMLCAVGKYQEACSQLQDAGCWTDAATLAATHLNGSDYARVLQRWADHVLRAEHNIWRSEQLDIS
ncbi:hypothetical protein QQ045_022574 [Rhodiola kirilowii]